jgi:large subunit ribosomal protein L9
MKTEVILTHNIVGLGGESDQVKVAAGYARNYLFPHRLAIPVTQANKRHLESLKQRRAEREAHEFNTMTELSKGVAKLVCVIKVKTGDDGKLFGAVTAGMIADELKNQFDITLDKKKIHLDQSIRTLGEYEVALHLHPDVKTTLKIRVESTTQVAAPLESTTAGTKTEKPHTEKRGRHVEPEKTEKTEKSPANDSRSKSGKAEKPAQNSKPEKKSKAE